MRVPVRVAVALFLVLLAAPVAVGVAVLVGFVHAAAVVAMAWSGANDAAAGDQGQ
jgi:hypothetical protein